MDYMNFAEYYDVLTGNVEYPLRARRIHALVQQYIRTETDGTLLLDLACGTGSLSEELAKLGYDVIGVDNSPAMLGEAMEKKMESGLPIQYLCQDMRELDMYGTIDVTVCMLDSLNHLSSLADVQQVIDRVSLFAQPGGLFLFDMNTVYKHEEVLADKVFLFDEETFFCTWENRQKPDHTVDMQLTFFSLNEDGTYSRSDEVITEIAYPVDLIKSAVKNAGLELLAIYDADDGLEAPEQLSLLHDKTERALFIARKPEGGNQ